MPNINQIRPAAYLHLGRPPPLKKKERNEIRMNYHAFTVTLNRDGSKSTYENSEILEIHKNLEKLMKRHC